MSPSVPMKPTTASGTVQFHIMGVKGSVPKLVWFKAAALVQSWIERPSSLQGGLGKFLVVSTRGRQSPSLYGLVFPIAVETWVLEAWLMWSDRIYPSPTKS